MEELIINKRSIDIVYEESKQGNIALLVLMESIHDIFNNESINCTDLRGEDDSNDDVRQSA